MSISASRCLNATLKDMPEKSSLSPLISLARQLALQAAEQAIEKVRTDERLKEAGRSFREGVNDLSAELRERVNRPATNEEAEQARLKKEQRLAKQALMMQAQTPYERRVLRLLAEHTNWLGGVGKSVRYTVLLDTLGGHVAAEEMAIHRAVWSLAERRILRVSEFGEINLVKEHLEERA